MDMNKLLATLNGIEKGTIKGTAQKEAGAMKKILESFDKVQVAECGTMPGTMGGMPQREGTPVSMNISLNASGKENVDELMSLLKSAGLDSSSMSMPMPAKTMPMALAMDNAEMEEEEFSNAPDEKYSDTKYMTKDLSGGINGQKKMFKPAAGGDNPMAVESIKERLWAALKEKKAKPDFLDMDKDGNKKEPMKKAVADKKKAPVKEVSSKTRQSYTKAANASLDKALDSGDKKTVKKRDSGLDLAYDKKIRDMKKDSEARSKANEAAKPDFLDMDKDGNKKEPMKKAVADKKKAPFKK